MKTIRRSVKALRRQVAVLLLAVVMIFSLSACGTAGQSQGNEGGIVNDIKKMLKAEGRPYDDVFTGNVGDTLTNTFFAWRIKSVTTADSLVASYGATVTPQTNSYYPEGYRFVIVDMSAKNVYNTTNPVGNYDFYIIYEYKGETVEDTAYSAFMDDMYPDNAYQDVGETTSGKVIFAVPKEVTEIMICYYEFWEDEFEGNTYLFNVTLT